MKAELQREFRRAHSKYMEDVGKSSLQRSNLTLMLFERLFAGTRSVRPGAPAPQIKQFLIESHAVSEHRLSTKLKRKKSLPRILSVFSSKISPTYAKHLLCQEKTRHSWQPLQIESNYQTGITKFRCLARSQSLDSKRLGYLKQKWIETKSTRTSTSCL